MLEFILIAVAVFVAISIIVKSRGIFIRSMPYVLYIYLFLLFFEDSVLFLKIIIFSTLMVLSVVLILYKDFQKDNISESMGSRYN
ncbi:MAG: hypothetical protein ACOYN6_13355 [Ignavibacteria bacterium]